MEVRRDDGGQGDELTPDDVFCVAIEETLSARRDHHRVEHVVG